MRPPLLLVLLFAAAASALPQQQQRPKKAASPIVVDNVGTKIEASDAVNADGEQADYNWFFKGKSNSLNRKLLFAG